MPVESNGPYSGSSRVTPDMVSKLPIWETAYIFEVNEARNVKSNAQVAMSKNSDPVHFILRGGWE